MQVEDLPTSPPGSAGWTVTFFWGHEKCSNRAHWTGHECAGVWSDRPSKLFSPHGWADGCWLRPRALAEVRFSLPSQIKETKGNLPVHVLPKWKGDAFTRNNFFSKSSVFFNLSFFSPCNCDMSTWNWPQEGSLVQEAIFWTSLYTLDFTRGMPLGGEMEASRPQWQLQFGSQMLSGGT